MSPSSTSEARKRREGDTDTGPTPLPGYVLTTRGEAARAGWECIDIDDLSVNDVATAAYLADAPLVTTTKASSPYLVIARPPRPRMVTIELPADVRDRWAGGPDDMVLSTDPAVITAACRASRDAEQ